MCQFRLESNWLRSSPTEKDPCVTLKAGLNSIQKDVETLVRIQQVSCKNMQALEH